MDGQHHGGGYNLDFQHSHAQHQHQQQQQQQEEQGQEGYGGGGRNGANGELAGIPDTFAGANVMGNADIKQEVLESAGVPIEQIKHLQQREKNREAVRNCRKRKKEHAKQLNERIAKLTEENAKLRLELQLGGDHKTAQQLLGKGEEKELIQEMLQLVKQARNAEKKRKEQAKANPSQQAPPKSDAEITLRRRVQVYMERHQDHGRDRQKAIGFILGRLQHLVVPETLTKFYLHIMTSVDEAGRTAFEREEFKPLWDELNLTKEQMKDFAVRKRYAKRLRTELDCAFEKMESIVKRCRRNKKVGDSLNELTTILKPEQFARFVVWVYTNPACHDILDELWGKLLAQCDLQINKEIAGNPQAILQIKKFQENSAALAIRLFSVADSRIREVIAGLCVHPDVVLVDANNNVDKRGLKSVIRYVSYVAHAFDTQLCEKTKGLRSLNVDELSIESDPNDDKVTGRWRLSGVYIGRLRPRRSSPNSFGTSSSSPTTPFGFHAASSAMSSIPSNGFALPKSVSMASKENAKEGSSSSSSSSSSSTTSTSTPTSSSSSPYLHSSSNNTSGSPISIGSGAPEPLLTKEEQKERTVSFNVIVEFSFADPVKPELITEMIISWDAMSLVNQLGLLKSPAKGVLPPPNVKDGTDDPKILQQQQEEFEKRRREQEKLIIERQRQRQKEEEEKQRALIEKQRKEREERKQRSPSLGLGGPPGLPGVSKRGRENALQLATLFQQVDPDRSLMLANQILDQKCVFDDIHMGAKYTGIPSCLNYIRRLRRAFPKFEISCKILSEKKSFGYRPRSQSRHRSGSDASSVSSRSSGAMSPSSGPIPDVIEVKWEISGYYGGALVSVQRQCNINGKVFVTVSPVHDRIISAKLDIVAQDLMYQLGLFSSGSLDATSSAVAPSKDNAT